MHQKPLSVQTTGQPTNYIDWIRTNRYRLANEESEFQKCDNSYTFNQKLMDCFEKGPYSGQGQKYLDWIICDHLMPDSIPFGSRDFR